MIRTKEEILEYYTDDREHVSPIIQDYLDATPHHNFIDTVRKPNKAVQQFLDAQEQEAHNPIIDYYTMKGRN